MRVSGRRAAGRVSECSLWLPAGSGAVEGVSDGRMNNDGTNNDGTNNDGTEDGRCRTG